MTKWKIPCSYADTAAVKAARWGETGSRTTSRHLWNVIFQLNLHSNIVLFLNLDLLNVCVFLSFSLYLRRTQWSSSDLQFSARKILDSQFSTY